MLNYVKAKSNECEELNLFWNNLNNPTLFRYFPKVADVDFFPQSKIKKNLSSPVRLGVEQPRL